MAFRSTNQNTNIAGAFTQLCIFAGAYVGTAPVISHQAYDYKKTISGFFLKSIKYHLHPRRAVNTPFPSVSSIHINMFDKVPESIYITESRQLH